MEYAVEKAARLLETLVQAAQNNPNMDSPTVKVNKVREIGIISYHRAKKIAQFLPAFILCLGELISFSSQEFLFFNYFLPK